VAFCGGENFLLIIIEFGSASYSKLIKINLLRLELEVGNNGSWLVKSEHFAAVFWWRWCVRAKGAGGMSEFGVGSIGEMN
jgi:hypothetical protein